jgi:DNA topoisomerase-2
MNLKTNLYNHNTTINSTMSKKNVKKTIKKSIEDTYVKKTPLEHILDRPDTYVGDTQQVDKEIFTYEVIDNIPQIFKKTVHLSFGYIKIFDEIITNASDHSIRLSQDNNTIHQVTEIKVNINEDGSIIVYNNGDGIDIVKHSEHDVYIPEMIFGHLLTSTNYDDTEAKTVGGKNGYGAKLTNIFSTMFEIEVVDSTRKKKYIQQFRNNMHDKDEPTISNCKNKPYTKITFNPDYGKFEMTNGLDEDTRNVLYKRVYDLAACTDRDVHVWLNDVEIRHKSFDKYINLYLPTSIGRVHEIVNDRWEIVICTSPDDKQEQVSFVNGICTIEGGKHVEHVAKIVSQKVIAKLKLKKKTSGIKAAHIKDNMWIFVKSLINNPGFTSQTKQILTTPENKFGSTCNVSDQFITSLMKKTDIIAKSEMLCNYKESTKLTKTDGSKRSSIRVPKLDDANWAGTNKSDQCTLILTEGDSAKSLAIAGLSVVGRDRFGVFPLKGKLMNVRDVSNAIVSKNEEISNLKKILGLQQNKEYTDPKQMRYGHVMAFTDQDLDGSHIKGLLANLFHYFWASTLTLPKFFVSLATPIVKASKGSNKFVFYTLPEYNTWKTQQVNLSGYTIKYYKGLGTSTTKEAKEYFQNYDDALIHYTYNGDTDNTNIDRVFNKKKTDERKIWLQTEFNETNVIEQTQKEVSFTDFINKDLIHFSNYDNHRSLPSVIDGLKPSQRKVLYCVFKRNLKSDMKVAQLSGYVSEHSCYHHGEMSIHGTIVGMSHDFVGSNNIELLVPSGQFGTRLQGGKDHASARYIQTRKRPLTDIIFNSNDFKLLNYLTDDDMQIEPEWYMPILPMLLVNGSTGIGTGWSTNIPCFNPLDITNNITRLMQHKKMTPMLPWYRGFKGVIDKVNGKYVSKGIYRKINQSTIEITELPIGEWTDKYIEYLEESVIDNKTSTTGKNKQFIQSFTKHHTDTDVLFRLKFNSTELYDMMLNINNFEKMLRITSNKSINTSNMHAYNKDGVITKYNTPEDILREFYDIRLEYYVKRRNFMLTTMLNGLQRLSEKIRFIEGIIEDTIIIYKKDDAEIEEMLVANKFIKISSNEKSEPSYDYLITMQIRSLTKKKLEQLKNEHQALANEHDNLESQSELDLWKHDLNIFETEYNRSLDNHISEKFGDSFVSQQKRRIKIKISK